MHVSKRQRTAVLVSESKEVEPPPPYTPISMEQKNATNILENKMDQIGLLVSNIHTTIESQTFAMGDLRTQLSSIHNALGKMETRESNNIEMIRKSEVSADNALDSSAVIYTHSFLPGSEEKDFCFDPQEEDEAYARILSKLSTLIIDANDAIASPTTVHLSSSSSPHQLQEMQGSSIEDTGNEKDIALQEERERLDIGEMRENLVQSIDRVDSSLRKIDSLANELSSSPTSSRQHRRIGARGDANIVTNKEPIDPFGPSPKRSYNKKVCLQPRIQRHRAYTTDGTCHKAGEDNLMRTTITLFSWITIWFLGRMLLQAWMVDMAKLHARGSVDRLFSGEQEARHGDKRVRELDDNEEHARICERKSLSTVQELRWRTRTSSFITNERMASGQNRARSVNQGNVSAKETSGVSTEVKPAHTLESGYPRTTGYSPGKPFAQRKGTRQRISPRLSRNRKSFGGLQAKTSSKPSTQPTLPSRPFVFLGMAKCLAGKNESRRALGARRNSF
ncbi:uncharacterized protein VTP21DRAFT_9852 [Calcarisporiella thermophila]|uniref:uncharacterized protein n=1 Tax=Calcarisporiella thermophila TaxID=911321 RepID=UPI0037421794